MIQVKSVSKTYISGEIEVRALKDITLDIQGGEFTSIAGPSGSGKSTLLSLIGCLDKADSGSIHINGYDLQSSMKKGLADLRRRFIGFIFQNYNLIPVLTAVENVAFVLLLGGLDRSMAQDRARDMLRQVGLEGMEDRIPSRLSGGQRQRVAIARALVKEPAIILADEPTANLDSGTGKEVLDLMRDLNSEFGTTFFISTHDPLVIERSRRLLQLRDGSIVSDSVGA